MEINTKHLFEILERKDGGYVDTGKSSPKKNAKSKETNKSFNSRYKYIDLIVDQLERSIGKREYFDTLDKIAGGLLMEKDINRESCMEKKEDSSKLIKMGYYVCNGKIEKAINVYNEFKEHINLLCDEEIPYLLLFLAKIQYHNGKHLDSFELVKHIDYKEITNDFLKLNARLLMLENSFIISNAQTINVYYSKTIEELNYYGYYNAAKHLKNNYLLYCTKHNSLHEIKTKLDEFENIDKKEYDFILSKSLFHNKEFDKAFRIAVKYHKLDVDFCFLCLLILNELEDEKNIKLILEQLKHHRLQNDQELLVEIIECKYYYDDNRQIKHIRKIIESCLQVDNLEILSKIKEEVCNILDYKKLHKESNLIDKRISSKINRLVVPN